MITTEYEFQQKIDAEPDNYTVRLVFADWLEERDDPRAEGYRALGRWKRCPEPLDCGREIRFVWTWINNDRWFNPERFNYREEFPMCLPIGWHSRMDPVWRDVGFPTRLHAEDGAALAYVLLMSDLKNRMGLK